MRLRSFFFALTCLLSPIMVLAAMSDSKSSTLSNEKMGAQFASMSQKVTPNTDEAAIEQIINLIIESVNKQDTLAIQPLLSSHTERQILSTMPLIFHESLQLNCNLVNVPKLDAKGIVTENIVCDAHHTPQWYGPGSWQMNPFISSITLLKLPDSFTLVSTDLFSKLGDTINQAKAHPAKDISDEDSAKIMSRMDFIVNGLKGGDIKPIQDMLFYDPYHNKPDPSLSREILISKNLKLLDFSEKIVSLERLSNEKIRVKALFSAKSDSWNKTDVENTYSFINKGYYSSSGQWTIDETDIFRQLDQPLLDAWIQEYASGVSIIGNLSETDKHDILKTIAYSMIACNTHDPSAQTHGDNDPGAKTNTECNLGYRSQQVQDKIISIERLSETGASVRGIFTATDPEAKWETSGDNSFLLEKANGVWGVAKKDLITTITALTDTRNQLEEKRALTKIVLVSAGAGFLIVLAAKIFPFLLLFVIFDVLMLMDVMKRPASGKVKTLWILFFICSSVFFLFPAGAIIYFFTARKRYKAQMNSTLGKS